MSDTNPTPLRVGAQGMLGGRRYTVAGRVVLGMELDGETYYWNEFNLVEDTGESATLVFEEGEYGPEWKLFTMFEPSQPMTAREAATKRVGDSVSLDGNPIRITLVDQSRVYHIEGEAPEGVEVGDVADYFNAESAQRMLVASWTGDEIEFYRGRNISAGQVAAAFNLPRTAAVPTGALARYAGGDASEESNYSGLMLKLVAVILLALIGYFIHSSWSAKRRNAPLVTQSAPASPLTNGMRGTLVAREYTIASQALVEVSKVGTRYEQREYDLLSYAGDHALLVCNLDGKGGWHLLLTPQTPPALPPQVAGGLRLGDTVMADEFTLRITDLFQTRTLSVTGMTGFSGFPGATSYNLLARSTNEWLMARWTEKDIQFYLGRSVPETTVLAAFGGAGRGPAQ